MGAFCSLQPGVHLIEGAGEQDLDIEGQGIAVLERIVGEWKIVHFHTSGRPR